MSSDAPTVDAPEKKTSSQEASSAPSADLKKQSGLPEDPASADRAARGGQERARFLVPDGDVAVLLNANAGRVRKSVVQRIRRASPEATIFWTRSLEEAQDAVEAILESGFTTVFAGGGDGTSIDLLNRLIRYEQFPRVGVLRLGTGNALATWVSAATPAEDLAAWSQGAAFREFPLRLVDAEGESTPFAGLGWDAAVLNDYRWVKQQLKGTPLETKSQHLAVYLASAFGRTVPRMAVSRKAPIVSIEVLEGEAWRVDRYGGRSGPVVGPGEVLYQGPAHMTAFGSTPYYGYAMKMLPHAGVVASHFQLRVSALSVVEAVNELPRIWTGDLEHERLFDFVSKAVRITFDEPVPYQSGGEARGLRNELVARMGPVTVPVLSFR